MPHDFIPEATGVREMPGRVHYLDIHERLVREDLGGFSSAIYCKGIREAKERDREQRSHEEARRGPVLESGWKDRYLEE